MTRNINKTIEHLENLANHKDTPKYEAETARHQANILKEKYYKTTVEPKLKKVVKKVIHHYENKIKNKIAILTETTHIKKDNPNGIKTYELACDLKVSYSNSFDDFDKDLKIQGYNLVRSDIYYHEVKYNPRKNIF